MTRLDRLGHRGVEALVVAVAIVWLLVVWFAGDDHRLGFPLDDAWIHMVYGHSLAHSGMLAFNPGTPTTGATSPAWAAVVALAHLLAGSDVDRTVLVVYLFGAAFQLVTVWLVARIAWVVTSQRGVCFVAGLLAATSGPLAMAAFSGMEVGLASVLVLAGLLACIRGAWLRAGVWLALAALARPELACVSVVCFAYASARVRHVEPRVRWNALARLAVPSLVLGALFMTYALWATGRPLPATFYMKQQGNIGALTRRMSIAVTGLLGDVPPFRTYVAYAALAGLAFRVRARGLADRILPLAAALAVALANLLLIQPVPHVFYHLRYLLPAVPLLIVACAIGANALHARWGIVALAVVGLAEGMTTVCADGRRLHNDIRNIDEVQRTLGEWVAAHVRPGAWVATGDAGAVRYFGDHPVVDVMGLNTPELYWSSGWGDAHPIAAFVMIPCWFQPRDASAVRIATIARTDDYSVTQAACMAEQVVITCDGSAPRSLAFTGMREVHLTCEPGGLLP